MNLHNSQLKRSVLLSAMLLALSACSSDSEDTTPPVKTETNSAPTISSTASNTVEAGSEYTYTLSASDSDGDSLTYEATTLPSWLTFDDSTATLTGTPSRSDEGDHEVVISVSDGTDSTTQTFTITVTFTNTAPEVTSTAITNATEDEAYSYTVTASDADNDSLTAEATTLPAWLSFDTSSMELSGTPSDSDVGDHNVVISISDGTDSTSHAFTITVEGKASETPVALTIYEDAANSKWAAWDCCGGSTPAIVDDGSSYGNVTEFTINGDTVVGFSTRAAHGAVGGETFNASNLTADGTIEFDLKLMTAPAATTDWFIKVESEEAATFAELNLSTSLEGHTGPEIDSWQHYTFNLSDLQSAGLDLSKIDVVMVFPAWGTGNGTVFRIDNVVIKGTGDTSNPTDPDPEPTKTTGDLTIYDNQIKANWLAWDCCGGSTPTTVTEGGDYGEVVEFMINGDTVVGFSTRAGHGATDGVMHDATDIVETGTLSFDLKMTASPGDTDWKLKLESAGGLTPVEINLSTANEAHAAPVLDTWQTYTFNLKDLQNAGLDVANIDIIMVYPAWGTGNGAVFRIDNVKISSTGATASTKPTLPLDFESSTFNYVLTDFGGASSSLVADPDSANARGTVAKTIKVDSAESWAGTTTSGPDGLEEAVPLTAEKTVMQVWVYSPESGLTVRLKLEDASDPTKSVETDAVTTMGSTWELIEFDFANQADGTAALDLSYTYNKASIFFNFGVDGATAGEMTFYWDSLMMKP